MRTEVRFRGRPRDAKLVEFVEARAARLPAWMRSEVRTARVWITDQNGPRGGHDCLVRVQLMSYGMGRVLVEGRGENALSGVAGAFERAALVGAARAERDRGFGLDTIRRAS